MVIGWVQHITDSLRASRLKRKPPSRQTPLLEPPSRENAVQKPPLQESAVQKPPFRFHDLPLELHLQILETYVSTLYPRIVYRCFCHLCDPTPSTAISSQKNSQSQRNMHRHRYQGPLRERDTKFRRRFSYCEGLPIDPSIRSVEHGEGRSFDYPYGPGCTPPEPGIFLTSKDLRQQVIDVMMRIKPLYVFSQQNRPTCASQRYLELEYLPAWYRDSLKFGEELRPDTATIFWLMTRWAPKFPKLQEVRLNYGRVRMNTKMESSQEKLEWKKGVPRDLLEGMVGRRTRKIMRGIYSKSVQGREYEQRDIWLSQSGCIGWSDWHTIKQTKPLWEKKWKVVMLVEFRVRVRESKKSKRKWASVYATARETKDCRTYVLDLRLDDCLLEMEKSVEESLCLAAQTQGDDDEEGEKIYWRS